MSETPEKIINQLHDLLSKKGSETEVIRLILKHSNSELQTIKSSYQKAFSKSLEDDLKDKIDDKYTKKCLVDLVMDSYEYDARELKKSVKGLGTDEESLSEILGTRSNYQLEQIKTIYSKIFKGDSLIADVKDDNSGTYWQLLQELLNGKRGETPYPDEKKCMTIVEQLNQALSDKNKELNPNIIKFFTQFSPAEIAVVSIFYERKYKESIIVQVGKKFNEDTNFLMNTIINGLTNQSDFFAERIKKYLEKEEYLIRILVTRRNIDLKEIKNSYKRLFNKDLIEEISKKYKDTFKTMLEELINSSN